MTTQMLRNKSIGFAGAGKMAKSIIEGLLAAGFPENRIFASAKTEKTLKSLETYKINTTNDNKKLAENSDIIVLSVKPNVVLPVAHEIKKETAGKIIISIAAGVPLEKIEKESDMTAKVVRAMPNICATVLEAATAIVPGKNCTAEDTEIALEIFSSVGFAKVVSEDKMSAVTGLSGSGPAYIFQVIEALADGGVHEGLDRDTATSLAAQTVLGAAQMILSSGKNPGELKDMVCSPGGTTIAGVRKLEENKTRAAFMNAVIASSEKSKNMNKKYE